MIVLCWLQLFCAWCFLHGPKCPTFPCFALGQSRRKSRKQAVKVGLLSPECPSFFWVSTEPVHYPLGCFPGLGLNSLACPALYVFKEDAARYANSAWRAFRFVFPAFGSGSVAFFFAVVLPALILPYNHWRRYPGTLCVWQGSCGPLARSRPAI